VGGAQGEREPLPSPLSPLSRRDEERLHALGAQGGEAHLEQRQVVDAEVIERLTGAAGGGAEGAALEACGGELPRRGGARRGEGARLLGEQAGEGVVEVGVAEVQRSAPRRGARAQVAQLAEARAAGLLEPHVLAGLKEGGGDGVVGVGGRRHERRPRPVVGEERGEGVTLGALGAGVVGGAQGEGGARGAELAPQHLPPAPEAHERGGEGLGGALSPARRACVHVLGPSPRGGLAPLARLPHKGRAPHGV